jgi:hypothetical protein
MEQLLLDRVEDRPPLAGGQRIEMLADFVSEAGVVGQASGSYTALRRAGLPRSGSTVTQPEG